MKTRNHTVSGAGLGLRRALLGPLQHEDLVAVDFMEVAPENWINVGGRLGHEFADYTSRFPFVSHGLSLSLGGPSPWTKLFCSRSKGFCTNSAFACTVNT